MLILILVMGVAVVVCGIGWLTNSISARMLLWYMDEHHFPFPSDEEMKRGTRWVANHMLKDLFGSSRKGT